MRISSPTFPQFYIKRSFLSIIATIFNAIKNLGEPDSSIIFRKYYYGESSEKIAEILDMTPSNVDTRAHRAIKKLREMLGGK